MLKSQQALFEQADAASAVAPTPQAPPPLAVAVPRRQAEQGTEQPLPWQRWLCVYFHRLPLEVFTTADDDDAVAVIDPKGASLIVVSASDQALAQGVAPGMAVSAAQAVCPNLITHARDTHAEQRRLKWLAKRASEFSSLVSLQAPQVLYLEVAGSQRLLGALPELQQQLAQVFAAQGHRPHLAIAPTPRGACWLAQHNRQGKQFIVEHAQLRQAIGRLPVSALELPRKHHERLARSGLSTMADLLRLPRDGLARRFGQVVTHQLDQALGKAPQPLQAFAPPPSFAVDIDLPMASAATPQIMAAAERALAQLCSHLRARDRSVDRLVCLLFHERQPATRRVIGLRTASRDPQRMGLLLSEQLSAHPLPADVLAVRIEAPHLLVHAAANMDWLDRSGSDDWLATVERWQARLGVDAVRRLGTRADHRPEHAYVVNGPQDDAYPVQRRPVYLLAEPLPLQTRARRPVCGGPLVFLHGPERIEQGWWDGGDVSRDYYQVRDRHGASLWIYQDRQRLGWWLHGLFA